MKVMLDDCAVLPTRATELSAGLDLYSPVDRWIPKGGIECIDTGVHIQLASDDMAEVKGRSGLTRRGVMVPTGTIDADFRGSIGVTLYNLGGYDYHIRRGDRIAQLVVSPVRYPELELVDALDETARGGGGFGSTGR